MKTHGGWIKLQELVWLNDRVVPAFSFFIFHGKHVVGKMFSKTQFALIRFRFQVFGQNLHNFNFHNFLFNKTFYGIL